MELLAPTPENVARAAGRLREGGLVGMPTETVYGLAADARSEAAVARVFAMKGRPRNHPLIVHLAPDAPLAAWVRVADDLPERLAAAFWPGPLTLVLPRAEGVPDAVTGAQPTVALRVPAHPVAVALLRAFGGGVAAPSANRFGRVSPTSAAHVADEFAGEDLLVLDGGPSAVGLESTILDLSGAAPCVLRPGGVSVAELESVLGAPVALGAGAAKGPRVPGSLASHYAPATPTRLVAAVGPGVPALAAVLATRPRPEWFGGEWLQLPAEPAGYGAALYAALRRLDGLSPSEIQIEAVPGTPEWLAVRDRLERACAPRPVPATARAS